MKPEYATHAAEHGLKVPVLRGFMARGSYADGVVGVVPTVTYPSHTTMLTGVWPAEHGVVDNPLFDPLREHPNTWYWDFADIKVSTLYTAAYGAAKPGARGPSVTSWQAEAWAAGGSNAIMLRHPDDPALAAKVKTVLEQAKADPANGIETILTHDEIVERGGFPQASFLVDYKDGWDPGGALTGPVVQEGGKGKSSAG